MVVAPGRIHVQLPLEDDLSNGCVLAVDSTRFCEMQVSTRSVDVTMVLHGEIRRLTR